MNAFNYLISHHLGLIDAMIWPNNFESISFETKQD